MEELIRLKYDINELNDVSVARRKIATVAKEIGFSEKEINEIALAVTELGNNLIFHNAIKGRIICSEIKEADKRGLQIICEDSGPGIADLKAVMEEGFSSTGTLGIGLKSVRRLMDDFQINSTLKGENIPLDSGTKIIAKKFLTPKENNEKKLREETSFGIFTRSKFGEKFNGDNYFLKRFDDKILFSIMDGTGHGKEAFDASIIAVSYLQENYNRNLEDIINDLHVKLRKTRGVSIAVVLICKSKNILSFTGIGNITTKVYNSVERIKPVNSNGILGFQIKDFKVSNYPWNQKNVIVMTSDGISSNYTFEEVSYFIKNHPIEVALTILKDYGKISDDATVLVGGPV